MTYKIGFRKPPKHTQFKKGQSGNPKGRPKGRKNFKTILEKELNSKVTITQNGKKYQMTKLEALIKRVVMQAMSGDPKFVSSLRELMKFTGAFHEEDQPDSPEDLFGIDHGALLDKYLSKQLQREEKQLGSKQVTDQNTGDAL